jgi:hypothetical protein
MTSQCRGHSRKIERAKVERRSEREKQKHPNPRRGRQAVSPPWPLQPLHLGIQANPNCVASASATGVQIWSISLPFLISHYHWTELATPLHAGRATRPCCLFFDCPNWASNPLADQSRDRWWVQNPNPSCCCSDQRTTTNPTSLRCLELKPGNIFPSFWPSGPVPRLSLVPSTLPLSLLLWLLLSFAPDWAVG